MQDINNWLDIIKTQKGFKSDYQLAKYWQVSTSTISQYRRGRLRLPMAFCLEIAQLGYFHPLEIILSLEYSRVQLPLHKERIKEIYWQASLANADARMSARAFSTKWRNWR